MSASWFLLLSIGIAAVTIEKFIHLCSPDFVSKKARPPLYTYDNNNQLKSVTTPSGTLSYDTYQWTVPTKVSVPGTTRSVSYDALLRPTEIKVEKGVAGSNQIVMDYRYTYNPVSDIVQRQTQDGIYTYTYDNLDRLLSATPPTGLQTSATNPSGLPVEQYTHDGVHNRLSSAHQPGAWTYNADNQLIQYGSSNQQASRQYDANGQLIKETLNGHETDYQYDVAERLIAVTDANNSAFATYAYDPFGQRIKKVANGQTTYFQYGDEGLVAEYDANGNSIASYGWQPGGTWGTNPQFKREGTNTYFYATDHLGTPQQLTDESGNAVWKATAEAFGKTNVDATSTVTNNLRFPGQYYDSETGLNYNYFRDYDPTIGRYVEADPIGLSGGVNTYAYVSAHPTTLVDSLGLRVEWDGWVAGAGIVAAGGGALWIFDFTSECKCNQIVHIHGGISTLGAGAGTKYTKFAHDAGASGGGLHVHSWTECPDPSSGNGLAANMGVNFIVGKGKSFVSKWTIGHLYSDFSWMDDGWSYGFDVSAAVYVGMAAVTSWDTKCC